MDSRERVARELTKLARDLTAKAQSPEKLIAALQKEAKKITKDWDLAFREMDWLVPGRNEAAATIYYDGAAYMYFGGSGDAIRFKDENREKFFEIANRMGYSVEEANNVQMDFYEF